MGFRPSPRNPGATELKTPETANAAMPATDARTKTPRTSSGTPSRCSRTLKTLFSMVSGASMRPTPATATRPRSTANGVRSGSGAHCASKPERSVPAPRPPRFANTATKLASRRRPAGARSMMYAVAVPVKIPAESPETTRAT